LTSVSGVNECPTVTKANASILGFDSWTKGAHHFQRLVPAFATRGMALTLVHLGSWGNDPGRPGRETLGDLDVRDISSYGSNSLETVLDTERPSVVILLSTETFAHRALIRYCEQRSIKTLLLYHGLMNVLATDEPDGSCSINRFAYAKFVASKLGKLCRRTLPCYCGSLIRTRARHSAWTQLISDVARMAFGGHSVTAAADATTSKCAVYTQADISHAMRVFHVDPTDVHVVGNPDLERFGLTAEMLGCRVRRSPADCSKTIMYIETGLAAGGFVFASLEAFRDHLLNTAKALASQGLTMIFKPKPHPPAIHRFLVESLDGSPVQVITNHEFLSALQKCAACIVETTTLALVPALMAMPLFYANYDQLRNLRFGPVLISYPRGYALRDLTEVSGMLQRASEELDQAEVERWIASNAGPLPIEEMPHRVAGLVADMISEHGSA
jgi:hypothetical protein